jgi:hypothetical protein
VVLAAGRAGLGWVESTTDVSAGPLFVLLAMALLQVGQYAHAAWAAAVVDERSAPIEAAGASPS